GRRLRVRRRDRSWRGRQAQEEGLEEVSGRLRPHAALPGREAALEVPAPGGGNRRTGAAAGQGRGPRGGREARGGAGGGAYAGGDSGAAEASRAGERGSACDLLAASAARLCSRPCSQTSWMRCTAAK